MGKFKKIGKISKNWENLKKLGKFKKIGKISKNWENLKKNINLHFSQKRLEIERNGQLRDHMGCK